MIFFFSSGSEYLIVVTLSLVTLDFCGTQLFLVKTELFKMLLENNIKNIELKSRFQINFIWYTFFFSIWGRKNWNYACRNDVRIMKIATFFFPFLERRGRYPTEAYVFLVTTKKFLVEKTGICHLKIVTSSGILPLFVWDLWLFREENHYNANIPY